MTAPDQQNPDPEPNAGQGQPAIPEGQSSQDPAEGADNAAPAQPGSPQG